ncbi:MAG TPA: hypothetical protein VF056_14160 [Thermoleophilaceae bacterium]
MLHHNVFTTGGPDNTRKNGACPNNAVRERLYGTGEELRPLTVPRGYGYRRPRGRLERHVQMSPVVKVR